MFQKSFLIIIMIIITEIKCQQHPTKKSYGLVIILKTLSLNWSLGCKETRSIKKILIHMALLLGLEFVYSIRGNSVTIRANKNIRRGVHTSTFWDTWPVITQRDTKGGLKNDFKHLHFKNNYLTPKNAAKQQGHSKDNLSHDL